MRKVLTLEVWEDESMGHYYCCDGTVNIKIIENVYEYEDDMKMIRERIKNDNGVRYTFEEVKERCKLKIKEERDKLITKIPQYPQDFKFYPDDFGVIATDEQINKMIKEGIDELEDNKERQHAWKSSGKTVINISRLNYDFEHDDYYYEIEISHNVARNDTTDTEVMDRIFKDVD